MTSRRGTQHYTHMVETIVSCSYDIMFDIIVRQNTTKLSAHLHVPLATTYSNKQSKA